MLQSWESHATRCSAYLSSLCTTVGHLIVFVHTMVEHEKKGRCELKGGCGSNVYYSSQIR